MTLRALFLAGKDDAGAMAIVAAVTMTAMLGFAAMAVDVSALYVQKRQLQLATDAAALAAVFDLSRATSIANSSMSANGFASARLSNLSVSTGVYCPDASLAPSARFPVRNCTDSPAIGSTANAVRVTARLQSPVYFARVFANGNTRAITATSTASKIDEAGLSAGTGLLAINGGLFNAVLSSLLGGSISLTAVQYNGLVNTSVSALDFMNALATLLNISAGSYGSLLQSNVGVGTVLQAGINALNAEGNIAGVRADALSALTTLKAQIAGSPSLVLSNLFDLGVWQSQPIQGVSTPTALNAGLNVYQLATLAAQVANGDNAVAIPSATLGIPGVASVSAASTVIEPIQSPPFAFGPSGVSIHTSQVRLQVTLQLLNPVSLLGSAGVYIKLPVYIEVATGNATMGAISCNTNPSTDATVQVNPINTGIVKAYVGTVASNVMTNFTNPVTVQPATLVNVGITNLLGLPGVLTVTGSSSTSLGNGVGSYTFHQPSQVSAGQPAIGNNIPYSLASTGTAASLMNSLGGSNLALTPTLLGISLPLTGVTTAVSTALTPLFAALDGLIDPLLAALGIKLGYIDVYATGVRCGVPVLVQ